MSKDSLAPKIPTPEEARLRQRQLVKKEEKPRPSIKQIAVAKPKKRPEFDDPLGIQAEKRARESITNPDGTLEIKHLSKESMLIRQPWRREKEVKKEGHSFWGGIDGHISDPYVRNMTKEKDVDKEIEKQIKKKGEKKNERE